MRLVGDLEREAEFILGQDIFNEMREWYLYTLRGDWDYVFYVVRRSYVLALIFEEITGKKMKTQSTTSFLTDSAIPLLVPRFAAYYREKESFPNILFCDDLMIHGRNINFLIGSLENALVKELREYDPMDVSMALTDAIGIHVYTCSSNRLLLMEPYLIKMHFTRAEEPAFYYRLSGNISSLILSSGFANATYVVSGLMSEVDFIRNNLEADFIKTSYQNITQYTQVQYIHLFDSVKAVATLRLIKNKREKSYRAIPFVFLPNLDKDETKALHQCICGTMLDSVSFTVEDKEFLDLLLQQKGMRSYNELITMILGYTVLFEFSGKYQIELSTEDMIEEIHKIELNFPHFTNYDVEDFLRRIVKHPFIPDLKMIERMVLQSLSEERCLFCLSSETIAYSDKEILRELEDTIYSQGYTEEKIALLFIKRHYLVGEERNGRRVQGCGSLLRALIGDKDRDSVTKLIIYFLQMLDAGVITISSLGGNPKKVQGFSQFVKAGEQSMLLEPLRYMEYMPLLAFMYENCEQGGGEFETELRLYQRSELCDIENTVFDKLYLFCGKLKEIEQTPLDWNGNFVLKLELEGKDRLRQVMRFMSRQSIHVESYEKYLDLKR